MDTARIKKVDYFRKFKDWAGVFLNQFEDSRWAPPGFTDNFNMVIKFAETLDLPEEGLVTQEFCHPIIQAIRDKGGEVEEAYKSLNIPIFKSACLFRLLYGGEELRTVPCPEHKGKWGINNCTCCGSGFLPNKKTNWTVKEGEDWFSVYSDKGQWAGSYYIHPGRNREETKEVAQKHANNLNRFNDLIQE